MALAIRLAVVNVKKDINKYIRLLRNKYNDVSKLYIRK